MNNAMEQLRAMVMRAENKWTDTGLPRVAMVCAEACADQVYQPMLHFVLQGSKTLSIGDKVHTYEAGTFFLVPLDVPATGQIRPGGPGLPYLAISLTLDIGVVGRAIHDYVENTDKTNSDAGLYAAAAAPIEMTDAWLRMFQLMGRPQEIAMFAPMIEREIIFRVLQGPLAGQLKQMAQPDGRLSHIRHAIQWIQLHYKESFQVDSLAAMTDMSIPAFYRHFKAVTAMTPIQYQKRLRLLKARWILLFEPRDAASVAFTVGYESPSQFNREYARFFGLPPIRDMARWKTSPPDTAVA